MKRCPKCHYPNDDENKFCRECGTELIGIKNYCPYCDRIYTLGEKFCVECGSKLVAKSQSLSSPQQIREPTFRHKPKPTKSPPVRDKPKPQYTNKPKHTKELHFIQTLFTGKGKQSVPKEDNFGYVGYDAPDAEFIGKTEDELKMELDFVTRRYEDCKKSGDYMTSYYKDKKEILENLLEKSHNKK